MPPQAQELKVQASISGLAKQELFSQIHSKLSGLSSKTYEFIEQEILFKRRMLSERMEKYTS
jgi:hypothetical protein